MVCEVPRTRQLLLSKKGSFFEDPFFRDVWDDYNHAVRRIVNRFNRGWVSPSDRLRDSQYHSMYRTLRSARLNYSTHSARFKEEGNVYKLVMDVQEFLGGDITVRTAGGTVSVRGKLEMNAEEEAKRTSREDSDDASSVSGKSTSAKTLHRRFTLPADADCEKIESSLSRDAVLTVTIPKRTDIHYIPVNIEGEDNKENETSFGARGNREGTRLPGVKRPSDTPSEPNRKKSQDESVNLRRRNKQENQKEEYGKGERRSRRRSKNCDFEEISKSNIEKEIEKSTDDETNGNKIKRNIDIKDDSNVSGFRKREKSIYEDVQEINIPVRINNSETSDKIFRPSSFHEPVIHNIEIHRDTTDSSQDSDVEMDKKIPLRDEPNHSERRNEKSDSSTRSKYLSNYNNNYNEKPRKDIHESNFRTKDECELVKESVNKSLDSCKDQDSIGKSLIHLNGEIENETVFPHDRNRSSRNHSIPSIDIRTCDSLHKAEDDFKIKKIDLGLDSSNKNSTHCSTNTSNESTKHNLNEEKHEDEPKVNHEGVNGYEGKPKDKLETPNTSLFDRPASPISPGSRLVKIEQDPSLMEEGMFKDCWSDFSNTLQDVLSRLQELSSELSQSKILAATTPSAETSPPVTEKGWSDAALSKNDTGVSLGLPEDSSSSLNKGSAAHRLCSDVGGVGGSEGGTKDDNRSAHLPWRAGHGLSETCSLDDHGKFDSHKEGTKKSQKVHCLPNDASVVNSLDENINPSFKSERPSSLLLRNVASPQRKPFQQEPQHESPLASSSRPNSLFLSDTPPGSLLESLRKNSPVDTLHEDFLRRTRLSEPSACKANFVPVEVDDEHRAVPVGGQRKEEERSVSLSPSDSQSNAESVGSESESGNRFALESNSNSINKIYSDSDNLEEHNKHRYSPFKKGSFLNDLSNLNSPLQKVPKEDSGRNLDFEPNIDTSPESNLTDDSECSSPEEGIVRGHFTFPDVAKLNRGGVTLTHPSSERDYQALPSDVINSSDVTSSNTCANESLPEIPSDDAMVCERHLPPSPRVPRRDAKHEPLRFSRINRPRDLLLQEVRGDAEGLREPNGEMGGVLSKGRKATPSRACSDSFTESTTVKSPPAYLSSPSRKESRQTLPPEEPPVPSYVRLRTEPSKRLSGFAHVNSDNVRRMRDVWGSKRDPSPSHTPPRSNKVPPSPTRVSSRRSSDTNDRRSPSRTQKSESPRLSANPSLERTSYSFNRSSPSPDRGYSIPSYQKPTKSKIFRDSPPPSPKHTSNSKSNSPTYSSYTRKASQVSQDRSSPVPSSPCRRCSRGAKESPSPSPLIEKKKYNYDSRNREENPRSKSSSSTPSSRKDSPLLSPKEEAKRASKVHQKIFKRFRDANLQPDSEAICFKEEDDKYKMVLDVEEFVAGEVEVLQDDLVLTVKGRVERKEPKGGHVSVKTFHRTFNIPKNSREEDIDSALSNDGILTIYVPKKRERVIKIELVD